jgi:hypothetical protein
MEAFQMNKFGKYHAYQMDDDDMGGDDEEDM